jgi:hypothetical protein
MSPTPDSVHSTVAFRKTVERSEEVTACRAKVAGQAKHDARRREVNGEVIT